MKTKISHFISKAWSTGIILLLLVLSSQSSLGADIVGFEGQKKCQLLDLQRELTVFREGSFFSPPLYYQFNSAEEYWDAIREKSPVVNVFKKPIMVVPDERPMVLENFHQVAELYLAASPRLRLAFGLDKIPNNAPVKVRKIRFCGEGNINLDLFGFVVESQLQAALKQNKGSTIGTPPSVKSIPLITKKFVH